MLKTAALVLLSVPVLIVGALASSGCLVVDVKPSDGPRLIVPVPLFVARAALSFAPEEAAHVSLPEEVSEYSELALQIVDELRDAPDAVLVEVDDHPDHVLIEKIGNDLAIEVTSDDEEVSVRVPLEMAAELVESCHGGEVEVSRLLRALSSVSRTELVHVRSNDEEVKVWVW